MWEELTKSGLVLAVSKSVNINLIARLSVVYLTICILHCDKDFYKYTRKHDFNVEPAISFFLKMLSAFLVCCIHSNALQTTIFHGDFFHGRQCYGGAAQPGFILFAI